MLILVPRKERGEGFYFHVFMVKKPGRFRLILNFKPLKQSGIRGSEWILFSLSNFLHQNCYMATFDL